MLHLGDITKIHGGEVPIVDVVIGGSPCQDYAEFGITKTFPLQESGGQSLNLNGRGTCLWASEIEEFPIAVTKRRFGTAEEPGDMGRFLFPCGKDKL